MRKAAMAIIFILSGLAVFAQNGVMRELSGTVELRTPGASSFVSAKTGD